MALDLGVHHDWDRHDWLLPTGLHTVVDFLDQAGNQGLAESQFVNLKPSYRPMKTFPFVDGLLIAGFMPDELRAEWRIGAAAMANRERFSGQMSPR